MCPSTTRGNSVVTRYGYDGASRLTSLAHDYPSAQDVSQTLSYNPAGQILSEVTTPALYDLPISGSSTVDYADNKLHQYTSVGGEAVSHDLDGAATARGANTYAYDADSRLTGANAAGGAALSYDAAGRLYELSIGGARTQFLYDGGQLAAEYVVPNGLTRRHIPGAGADETLATLDGAGLTHILADVRGTPMALVLPNGAVDVERYGVFGEEDPANLGRFGFTGQMRIPELGLFYYKNRFYDPKTGRFLTPDPLGYVDGPNLYAYVLNDPVNNVDPSGLTGESPVTVGDDIVVRGKKRKVEITFFEGPLFLGGGGGGSFFDGGGGGGGGGGNAGEGMGPRPPCSVVSIGVQAGFAQGVGGNVGASAFFDFASGRIGIALTSGPTAGEGAFGEIQLGLRQYEQLRRTLCEQQYCCVRQPFGRRRNQPAKW